MIQFTLTEQQADYVLNALGQRPFLEVQGLISELLKQVQAQSQQRQAQQQIGEQIAPLPAAANGAGVAAQ